MSNKNNHVLVEARNLSMFFPIVRGIVRRKKIGDIKAVDNINFFIKQGETLGLVGESGCGKTTVGRCLLQLYRPTAGDVFFEGTNLCDLTRKTLRPIRRRMQIIFQDPYGSLNPRRSAEKIIGEPIQIHRLLEGEAYQKRVEELFDIVGLNTAMTNRYPHEFSGGQRQRIGIARALAAEPSFIVCDEPISALDVSIQAQTINLLENLQERFNLTFLFIAHDMAVVRHISNRIMVMYLGKIVEVASREDLYNNPLHPYTRALLSAVPIPDPTLEETRHRIVLSGEVPSPFNPPLGCRFHPRCLDAKPVCSEEEPVLMDMGSDHQVACHLF
ncbi:ABC transporter ATP-binding protein [Thermodesulfobacteriota bacterium]